MLARVLEAVCPLRPQGALGLHRMPTREGQAVRLLVPVLPWVRKGYDINVDEWRHGLWMWSVALAVERDSRPGFSVSVRWGWIEKATSVVRQGWER